MSPVILELVQGMDKGGRTKRIAETSTSLGQRGWTVNVVSMTPVPDWVERRYLNSLDQLPLYRRQQLDLTYILKLSRLVKAHRISLIHAHCEASFFYGGLAGRICRIPVVGTYHRSELRYFKATRKLRFYASLLTRAVAISRDRMNLMVDNLGIDADRITLIHGGVDLNEYRSLATGAIKELRTEYGVENRRVLLSVGHLGPIKGHQITLQAMPEIVVRFPDVLLVIAGDGEASDYDRLRKLIQALGMQDHVRLLGQTHNVIDWMNICDLFVQPSLEEGFGLVFIEAGACKKAVVATAVGGIKDIIQDGVTGSLVAPGDADSLRKAIISLLEDSSLRETMAAAGLARVREHFSLQLMGDKYHELLSSLV